MSISRSQNDEENERRWKEEEKLEKQFDEMRSIIGELTETVIWMSGSSDFSPEGQAGTAWAEQERPKLTRALNWIKANPAAQPNGDPPVKP